MRIAVGQFSEITQEMLQFAAQLGVGGIQLNTPLLPGAQRWDERDLRWLRERCATYGLRLEAIENVPLHFYDKAMLGLPGKDEQIENYQATIRALGRAGIPILGYHWMPLSVWRTSKSTPGRGGTRVSSFDSALIATTDLAWGLRDHPLLDGRTIGAEEMWQNYTTFIQAVLPVAEEAGVTLALHPDDPPVATLGGVARLFWNFEGFERAMQVAASPNHGLDFCMGCWSEMGVQAGPGGVLAALRHFGRRGQLAYLHFRDVQGTVPAFQECFLGEGNVDTVAALRVLHEVGFDGFLLDDHVPHLSDDTEWGHRARAHAIGYMSGLIQAITGAAPALAR